MKQRFISDRRGEISVLVVPLVLAVLMLAGAIGFGAWAYSGRQDYKNNVTNKVAAAVKVAKQEEGIEKDKQHAEADKQPLKTFNGPDEYGGVSVSYPKTWSAYVVNTPSQPMDAYFQPDFVPNTVAATSIFALRVQVLNVSYATATQSLNNLATQKKITAAPFAFPKVPNVVGVRYDGIIDQNKKTTGTMIILPLRDKTLKVFNENPQNANDLTTFIIPNIVFSP